MPSASDAHPSDVEPGAPGAPGQIRAAAAIVVGEALALVGAAGVVLSKTTTGHPHDVFGALGALARRLLDEEGLCLGLSSGINVAGAVELAKSLGPGSRVATILCDTGFRYLSTLYNDEWLAAKGLVPA